MTSTDAAALYAAIEQRHHLAVPPVYREMQAAGLLDPFGRADWRDLPGSKRAAMLRARALRGESLYLPQVEWYSLDEILDFAPGTWADGLLPFAGNGAGDHWCWYTPWATDGQVPVVFYDHELWQGTAIAVDFTAAVYRLLLESFAAFTDTKFTPAQVGALFSGYAQALRHYLPAPWLVTLETVGAQPVTRDGDGNYALLSREACTALVEEQLAFPDLNRSFRATNY